MLRRIFANTSAQLIGKVATSAFTFVSTLILARALGAQSFGIYVVILSYLALFYVFVDFGLNPVFLQEHKEQVFDRFPILFWLRLGLGAILFVVAIVGMFLLSMFHASFSPLMILGVGIGSISILALSLSVSFTALYQMMTRYDLATIAQLTGGGVGLGLLLVFYPWLSTASNWSLLLAIGIGVIVQVTTAVVAGWLLRKRLPSLLVLPQKAEVMKLLYHGWPLGLTLVVNSVYFRLDTLVLNAFRSPSEIGNYGLAYKFFEFVLVLPSFAMNSLFPHLLHLDPKSENFKRKYRWLLVIFFVLSFVVVFAIWTLAPLLGYIRDDFKEAQGLLRILSLGLPLFFISSPLMWRQVLLKKQRDLVPVYFFALFFNVGANLFLTPQYGATAAAGITGVTEFMVVLGFIFIKQ